MTATNAIRILCVDDHEFLSQGLAARLNLERDMTCVGCLPSADGLPEQVKNLRADIVILDLEMPGPDSLGMIAELKKTNEDVRVLILSAHVRDHYIDRALEYGADGYFSKSDTPSSILDGIRTVMQDTAAFGSDVQERLESVKERGKNGEVHSKLSELTTRELEVLRLVGMGLSRADISRQLFRSLKTIDAHHTSIMRKLDIHDRAELTRYAIREGLCET